ncbi:MAG: hypothetical protein JWN20_1574, partial [Jatrophihabitantaceae bacterium]|nr:hypothetical protein [Jatrophihabitantaceae bacterium]
MHLHGEADQQAREDPHVAETVRVRTCHSGGMTML